MRAPWVVMKVILPRLVIGYADCAVIMTLERMLVSAVLA